MHPLLVGEHEERIDQGLNALVERPPVGEAEALPSGAVLHADTLRYDARDQIAAELRGPGDDQLAADSLEAGAGTGA